MQVNLYSSMVEVESGSTKSDLCLQAIIIFASINPFSKRANCDYLKLLNICRIITVSLTFFV